MAIELEYPTVRFTTTQTQSFRRAPMAGLGDVFDDIQDQWNALGAKFYGLVGVDAATTKAFDALIEKFGTWVDASVQKGSRVVTQAQVDGLAQALKLYNAALAAGAKPGKPLMVKTGTGKTTALPGGDTLFGATGVMAVVLGLAALLFVLPRRGGRPALSGLGNHPRFHFKVKWPGGPTTYHTARSDTDAIDKSKHYLGYKPEGGKPEVYAETPRSVSTPGHELSWRRVL